MTLKPKGITALTRGYTIDQTVLIVVIIAILVTIIILTVGWNLITKASGAKLASQFRQMEDSVGEFYAAYRVWPHESYTAPPSGILYNMPALAGMSSVVTFSPIVTGSPEGVKNFIPGIRFKNVSGVQRAQHTFGGGNATGDRNVYMLNVTNPWGNTGKFLVVRFDSVPFSEVEQAERSIDGQGAPNYGTGRVVAVDNTANCAAPTVTGVPATTTASTLVNACYAANLVQ